MTDAARTDEADLRARLSALSLEEKVRLLTGADMWTLHPEPRAGLRQLVFSDGPNGVRGQAWLDERDPALLLPNPTALAATWDPEVAQRAGRLFAAEARRKRVHVLLAPAMNLHRSPLGGRNFENFSEDPLLTSRVAVGYVRGVQSGGVAAVAKHFVANDSETDRTRYDAVVDERTLREVYLAPFEAAVKEAAVWGVMAAYNGVNGDTMTENAPLLNGVLKEEWGFDGPVVSDWTAARSTEGSALAGLDLVMPGPGGPWGGALVAAVRENRVSESLVDDKVLRLLRLAARLGALEEVRGTGEDREENAGGSSSCPVPPPPTSASGELREIAARSMVLLRNEGGPRNGLLPLDPADLRRIALVGPAATDPTVQGGGSAQVVPPHVVTPAGALREALPEGLDLVVLRGVRARRNLTALSPDRTLDPETGERGVRVDFLGADGRRLDTEHRNTARLVWQPGSLPKDTREIAVRARLTGAEAGRHALSIAGVGAFRIFVNGEERLASNLVPDTDDPILGLQRPPEARTEVELAEGDAITVEARRAIGEDALFVAVTLGHEPPGPGEDEELEVAVEAARNADVAVVAVGTTDEVESEGFDRTDLSLPGRQDELVRRVAEVNPRTIVAVNAGAPVLMPWAEKVPAVLWTWFGGQEYGSALADVLVGVAEPGGRLPTTFPADTGSAPVVDTAPTDGLLPYNEGILVGHRSYDARGIDPAFAFGHGLGYTNWRYEVMRVEPPEAAGDAVARIRITNSGSRTGREVVQCYAEPASGTSNEAPRRLVGSATVELAPGESAEVAVNVSRRALSTFEPDRGWRDPSGAYLFSVGRSSRDLRLRLRSEPWTRREA